MTGFRTTTLAAVLLAASALRASAQGECKIDEGKPGQVKDARNAIVTRELAGSNDDKKKSFVKAVGLLTKEPEKLKSNMIGRNLLLGRALIDLWMLPEVPKVSRRGDLGYLENPEGMIDILAAADTALDAVDAEQPLCKDETEEPRRKAYGELVNQAVNHYNNREVDSAETKVRQGLMIYDGYRLAYIAYNVLGNVQQSRDDNKGAIKSFRTMAELMAGDTTLVDERKKTMLLVANLMTNEGETLEAEPKKTAMAEVVTYLEGFLKEWPGDIQAQSSMARAQLLSGDAVAAKRLFDEMLANPDKYTDLNLFEAGVGAARADQYQSAAALFEAGLKKNPYSRDGLFNVAAIYDQMEAHSKMPAVLEKLLNVDPENPDNYRLWARYWQARAKALKAAEASKDTLSQTYKDWAKANESLMASFTRMQEAPVKVSFSLFSHEGGRHVLAGAVENLTDAEKTYALKFEFLDNAGAVLDSREVPVAAVAGKSSKSFRVEITDKPGVVAYRYAPIPKG